MNVRSSLPFLGMHLVPLLAVFTGVTAKALVLCAVLYVVRMFGITAGYHRYFSHRSYKASRPVQLALAILGTTTLQKGPLWWAAHHRSHHRHSDTEDDIHSPQKGFWWSHVGWILCDKHKGTDLSLIRDLTRFPELRAVERFQWAPPLAVALGTLAFAGWSGLVVGFVLSTVLLWHGTFTINSLSHTFGTRRYATSDTSRNNPLLAAITLGEGWHNNHHHHQASARQGFYWWEVDVTWIALRGLAAVRLVRDLRQPSAKVLASGRIRDGAFDVGLFRQAWRRASVAVQRSRASAATPVAAAGSALAAAQADVEATIRAKRAALEEAVAHALAAADDLTKTTRRASSSTPG